MPELPEVETVCRGLAESITGLKIERVVKRRADLRVPFPKGLEKTLTGKTISKIERRAKYLLIHLSGEVVMLAHLGMSGKFLVKEGHVPPANIHDHLVLYLSGKRTLIFNDPRRFGLILLCDEDRLAKHALLKNIGVEPLSSEFNAAHLAKQLAKKSQPIKNAIMDQRVVAGVGNIYAAEALFASGIHPMAASNKLSKARLEALVKSIKEVLRAAIKSGGSTLRDYVRSSGDAGYFQHSFAVYDRENDACKRCGGLIKSLKMAGRSSFFCSSCQKR